MLATACHVTSTTDTGFPHAQESDIMESLPCTRSLETNHELGRNTLHYVLPSRLRALSQCTPCNFNLRRRGTRKSLPISAIPTRQNPPRLAKSKANNALLSYTRAPPTGAYRISSILDLSGVQVSVAPSNFPDAGLGAFLTFGLAEDGTVPPGTILTEYGGVHFTAPLLCRL